MKIKNKILRLLALLVFSVLISLMTYSIATRNLTHISREQHILAQIENLLKKEKIYTIEYLTLDLNMAEEQYKEISESEITVSSLLNQMIVLPKKSDEIVKAMSIIQSVEQSSLKKRNGFLSAKAAFLRLVEEDLSFLSRSYTNAITSPRMQTDSRVPEIRDKMIDSIKLVTGTLDLSLETLSQQTAIIEKEIKKIQTRSYILVAAIIIPLLILVFWLSLILIKSIIRSIRSMEDGIGRFMTGDLTYTIDSSAKDELGELSGQLNLFRTRLKESISSIKEVSHRNKSTQEQLKESVINSHKALTKAAESADIIEGSSGQLTRSMETAVKAVRSTFTLIDKLGNQINEQLAMVEQSSTAITEMISSVDSIASMIDNCRRKMDELIQVSNKGQEIQNEARESITKMEGSVEAILGMVETIDSLASQTNLLSMNAAIEAAHAGEAGRGFSVVAEEIGSLAEVSGDNATEISSEIHKIVEQIQQTADAGRESSTAYEEIKNNIHEVENSYSEVFEAIHELKQGSIQIQEAVSSLNDVSSEVSTTSNGITSNTQKVLKEVEQVNQISSDVKEKSSGIQENMKLITLRMERVESASMEIENGSKTMESALRELKTEEEF